MAVEARFKVSRVSPWDEDGNTGEVEMTPDYADGKNKEWSEFTLSGVCRLSITNPDAFTQFVEGAAVAITLDITPPA